MPASAAEGASREAAKKIAVFANRQSGRGPALLSVQSAQRILHTT
ncbi:MAG: hypothetical protein ABI382_10905 [Nakamurella sp.]